MSKLRTDLMPILPLARLAEVYTIGAKKYAPKGWEQGQLFSENYGALLRHLFRWAAGEDKDPIDGNLHLASVMWRAAALMQHQVTHPELDDVRVRDAALRAEILQMFAEPQAQEPAPLPVLQPPASPTYSELRPPEIGACLGHGSSSQSLHGANHRDLEPAALSLRYKMTATGLVPVEEGTPVSAKSYPVYTGSAWWSPRLPEPTYVDGYLETVSED